MGFLDGLVKAVFDPAGVLGNWEDTPSGPPVPATRSEWNGKSWSPFSEHMQMIDGANNKLRMQGYMEQMGASSDPLLGAFNPDVKVKPSDWSAQWSYTPGRGPQWVEPQRVSPNNDVPWAPVVNTGPAKGNRI